MSGFNFSIDEFSISVNGVPIDGYAKGSVIEAKRNEDEAKIEYGGDGDYLVMHNPVRGGTFTIHLTQESKSNDYLSTVLKTQRASRSKTLCDVAFADVDGTSYGNGFCVIKTQPETSFGSDHTNRTWVFEAGDFDQVIGGNIAISL
jgi:hypothetical protein